MIASRQSPQTLRDSRPSNTAKNPCMHCITSGSKGLSMHNCPRLESRIFCYQSVKSTIYPSIHNNAQKFTKFKKKIFRNTH